MRLYLESLEQLLELEIERIYPGHGPAIDAPHDKIREYLSHRREREEQIVNAIQAGAQTVERMVEHIYVDTPRVLYPAAGQSVLSHLVKLEQEQRAERTNDASGEEYWALC